MYEKNLQVVNNLTSTCDGSMLPIITIVQSNLENFLFLFWEG